MAGSGSVVRAEILRRRRELGRLPAAARDVPAKKPALEAQRAVDNLEAIADGVRRDRARAVRQVEWLESETAGFEKALLLVSAAKDADGTARLEKRLGERRSRLETARRELGRFDARLATLEAGVTAAEADLAKALDAWLTEAQDRWVASGWGASVGGSPAVVPPSSGPRGRRRSTPRPASSVAAAMSPPPEMWSPTAVFGYRAWIVARDGLTGAWHTWTSSRMTAVCTAKGEVPHTDGRCARVAFGCGVYAATSAADLMREAGFPDGFAHAVGLVGLEGKVVEHERGYRAEHATVLALAVVNPGRTRVETLDDPASVAAFFASKGTDLAGGSALAVGNSIWGLRAGIDAYLKERKRRYETWTSANRPA